MNLSRGGRQTGRLLNRLRLWTAVALARSFRSSRLCRVLESVKRLRETGTRDQRRRADLRSSVRRTHIERDSLKRSHPCCEARRRNLCRRQRQRLTLAGLLSDQLNRRAGRHLERAIDHLLRVESRRQTLGPRALELGRQSQRIARHQSGDQRRNDVVPCAPASRRCLHRRTLGRPRHRTDESPHFDVDGASLDHGKGLKRNSLLLNLSRGGRQTGRLLNRLRLWSAVALTRRIRSSRLCRVLESVERYSLELLRRFRCRHDLTFAGLQVRRHHRF